MKRIPSISLPDRLAALAEPIRLRIVAILDNVELSVGEVGKVVQLPQSTVSRHLKVLADAGFLDRRSDGTATLYRLSPDDMNEQTRGLWQSIAAELRDDPDNADDRQRVQAVIAERRVDSLSFFGRVAGEWDVVRNELFGERFTLRSMLGFLPREWVVADLGCGTGNGAELVAPVVREVIAIDQSGPMLDAARKRLAGYSNVRFLDGPIEALPLPDASCDAAMCLLVLHHVPEPADAIREMRRILKPGGRALIVDMLEHDRHEYRHMMGHRHLGFSSARMTQLLEQAEFTDPRIIPLSGDPGTKGPGMLLATAQRPPISERTQEH